LPRNVIEVLTKKMIKVKLCVVNILLVRIYKGMTNDKILSYKNKTDNIIVIVVLIISIVITNSFIIFSPDEDSRFYFSGLTSTLTVGVALVISIVMVYRYKRSINKQEEKQQALSQQSNDMKLHYYYYDNNKIHFSI
jgi:uncharacterized membrane protein